VYHSVINKSLTRHTGTDVYRNNALHAITTSQNQLQTKLPMQVSQWVDS